MLNTYLFIVHLKCIQLCQHVWRYYHSKYVKLISLYLLINALINLFELNPALSTQKIICLFI